METKLCPYCSEEIKVTAKKCKHCGEWLDKDYNQTQKVNSGDSTTLIKQALTSKYDLHEEVGKGGMAVVYKATQKNLNRTVALKVVHQNLVHDTEFLARFHREAQTAASLNHNNLVTIHDEGQEAGVHYMTMEFLDGIDLHKLIKENGALSVDETVKFIAPIAKALQYAHDKGIIHRDIKSSNIIITNEGRAVLTDFGIAHAASGTKLTQTGTVIGTPEYMSPEQAAGKDLDGRSDLYSLGVVLYECLTGQVPHKGDNPLTTIHKIIYDPVVEVKLKGRDVPAWLNTLVNKTLEKEKENRVQKCSDLATSLETQETPKIKIAKESKSKGSRTEKVNLTSDQDKREPVIEKSNHQKQENAPKKKNTGLKAVAVIVVIILLGAVGLLVSNNIKEKEAEQERQKQESIAKQQRLEEQKSEAVRLEKEKKEQEEKEMQQKIAEQKRLEEKRKREEQARIAEQKRLEAERNKFRSFTEKAGGLNLEMITVQGGTFQMGSSNGGSNEKPVHSVTVSNFYIGKYEVTQAQWKAVMGSNPSHFKGDNLPVERVSWNDIQKFLKKLNQKTGKNYRLPTEAEWEYASRGGNKSRGYKYSGSNSLGSVGWYDDNSGDKTDPVGRKQSNELGIYDMSGNVYEWCSDWYSSSYYSSSPRNNPQGPSSGSYRVLRGGGWAGYASYCRVAYRIYYAPDYRYRFIGFRLALSSK